MSSSQFGSHGGGAGVKLRVVATLRRWLDWWSPPPDAPVDGHVLLVGPEHGQYACFRMSGQVTVSLTTKRVPAGFVLVNGEVLTNNTLPRVGVVVRLGERVAEMPDWLSL